MDSREFYPESLIQILIKGSDSEGACDSESACGIRDVIRETSGAPSIIIKEHQQERSAAPSCVIKKKNSESFRPSIRRRKRVNADSPV